MNSKLLPSAMHNSKFGIHNLSDPRPPIMYNVRAGASMRLCLARAMTDYQSPSKQPSASVVVVSYNTSAHIGACLLSLLELNYPQLEIIVVDNGSSDGSVE